METAHLPSTVASDLSARINSRVLVATTSAWPANLHKLLQRYGDHSGVVAVGKPAGKRVQALRHACGAAPLLYDPAEYLGATCTAQEPFTTAEQQDSLFPAPDLAAYLAGSGSEFDAVLSPTGFIPRGESKALRTTVEKCNELPVGRLICSLPIDREWLRPGAVDTVRAAIADSAHLVSLTVVGQLDPFEDTEVLGGLVELLNAGNAFLHRTDTLAVTALTQGAVAASVGAASTMRHTVPPGQFPRTRKKKADEGVGVFVPGISEFHDVATLEEWFGDSSYPCPVTTCHREQLTSFTASDRPGLAAHNMGGVLELAEGLLTLPQSDWMTWLRDHYANIEIEFNKLRAETGRRDLRQCASAKNLATLVSV